MKLYIIKKNINFKTVGDLLAANQLPLVVPKTILAHVITGIITLAAGS